MIAQMNDERDFMLHPDRWAEGKHTFWCKKIFLKRGSHPNYEFAQLAFLKGRYGFCQEKSPFEADLSTVRWGGPELVDEILKDRWEVD
jgi:hypothetical protein